MHSVPPTNKISKIPNLYYMRNRIVMEKDTSPITIIQSTSCWGALVSARIWRIFPGTGRSQQCIHSQARKSSFYRPQSARMTCISFCAETTWWYNSQTPPTRALPESRPWPEAFLIISHRQTFGDTGWEGFLTYHADKYTRPCKNL